MAGLIGTPPDLWLSDRRTDGCGPAPRLHAGHVLPDRLRIPFADAPVEAAEEAGIA
jgi:hypothetical protein